MSGQIIIMLIVKHNGSVSSLCESLREGIEKIPQVEDVVIQTTLFALR